MGTITTVSTLGRAKETWPSVSVSVPSFLPCSSSILSVFLLSYLFSLHLLLSSFIFCSISFPSSLSHTSLLCYPAPPSPTQKDKDKDKHDKQDKSHATPSGTPQTGPPQAPQAGANPTSTPTPASSTSVPLTQQQSPPQSSTPSNTPTGAVPPGGAAPGPLPVNGPPKHAGVAAVHPQHLVGPPLSPSLSLDFCCFSCVLIALEASVLFVRRGGMYSAV